MKAKMSNLVNGAALTLLAGAITTINPSPAYAVDTKNYPALTCVRHHLSGGTIGYWAGGVTNENSVNSLEVLCPVIKDVMTQGIYGGWVRVWDTHYNKNISCQLASYRFEDGGHVSAWTNTVSSVGSNNNQDLQILTFPGLSTAAINANSHYYYGCQIPPKYNGAASFISSYSVIENGQNE